MFIVMKLCETVEATVLGRSARIPMIWADGMSGALPLFKDRESAEKHAAGAEIVEVEILKSGEDQGE